MSEDTQTDELLIECFHCGCALNGKDCWIVILESNPTEPSTICEDCYVVLATPEELN
jgi:hypothetical protein